MSMLMPFEAYEEKGDLAVRMTTNGAQAKLLQVLRISIESSILKDLRTFACPFVDERRREGS